MFAALVYTTRPIPILKILNSYQKPNYFYSWFTATCELHHGERSNNVFLHCKVVEFK
ncbi:hypothetical protein Hanom_Chr02g00129011 [Helianthus anomalus]